MSDGGSSNGRGSAAQAERRVVVLPSTRRDAEAIRAVCSACGIGCEVVDSMEGACDALGVGAAALVVAEEALAASPAALLACLRGQPVWADLPIVVLSRAGSESPRLTGLLEQFGNVSVVERPVRVSTFLSIVKVAIRGRERQYEVREHLVRMKAVEAERTALWESELSARAEAEHAARIKEEFLATLSHEIRTPLNAILGWAHLLGQGEGVDEAVMNGIKVIERNARAQAQIVSDLLDMNRIMNGKVRLDIRPVELAEVVRAAVDTVKPAAEAKGIRIDVDIDPSTGSLSADPDRLQQVFWNLLSNAVKFTPQGERVRVTVRRVHSHVEVRVVDTGEGIDPDFLPHVFDRFRQADGSSTRRHGGLGLGLAIVKQLVELHGGEVRAESAGLKRGSTFMVVLPDAAAHLDAAGNPPSPGAGPAGTALRPSRSLAEVRVLVVDDERDARDLVQRILETRNARVSSVSSAAEAMELIGRWRPHVLVSDIGMPGEDGYTLIRRVRALDRDKGGGTVAIALTAYARPEDRANTEAAGFQYHISKPLDAMELLAVVSSAAARADGLG